MHQVNIPPEIETLTKQVVDGAFTVHSSFGPGLLENVYRKVLAVELGERGLSVEQEKPIPLVHRNRTIENSFRADMLINGLLLVELKTVESIQPIHRVQTVTYLKLLHLPLALLINFNTPLIKDGIHRVLNLQFRTNQIPETQRR